MKSLELTEEHTSKLLEMCETLFPEWDLKTYDESFDDLNNGLIRFKTKTGLYKSFTFHWFEFCSTILLNKLYLLLFKNNLTSIDDQSIFLYKTIIENHPVDFLYKEFRKLKNV